MNEFGEILKDVDMQGQPYFPGECSGGRLPATADQEPICKFSGGIWTYKWPAGSLVMWDRTEGTPGRRRLPAAESVMVVVNYEYGILLEGKVKLYNMTTGEIQDVPKTVIPLATQTVEKLVDEIPELGIIINTVQSGNVKVDKIEQEFDSIHEEVVAKMSAVVKSQGLIQSNAAELRKLSVAKTTEQSDCPPSDSDCSPWWWCLPGVSVLAAVWYFCLRKPPSPTGLASYFLG